MPKRKTNRTAYRKFRVGGKGTLKKAQANTSHNTAKKPQKRMRQLRARVVVDGSDDKRVRRMLPYHGVGH